jgi:hypothetical protein
MRFVPQARQIEGQRLIFDFDEQGSYADPGPAMPVRNTHL